MAQSTFHSTAGLAWATPIRADFLGAHLEAYKEYIAALRTLRLCHQLGNKRKGAPTAFITRLPPELVAMIADFIIRESRAKFLRLWSRDLLCYEYKCNNLDHYTTHENRDLYCEYKDLTPEYRRMSAIQCSPFWDELDGDWDFIDGEHSFRCAEWLLRNSTAGKSPASTYRNFEQYSRILKDDFGLQRIFSGKKFDSQNGHCTTTCYLTLHSQLLTCSSELPDDRESFEAAFEVDIVKCSPLSTTEKFRFSNAMKVLGLQPLADHIRKMDCYARNERKDKGGKSRHSEKEPKTAGLESSDWPKLLLLQYHETPEN